MRISFGQCFEWVRAITKQDNASGSITHALHGAFNNPETQSSVQKALEFKHAHSVDLCSALQ